MSTIRLRDNAKFKVRELNIPKEVLESLEKIVASNKLMDRTKYTMIRKLSGVSPCCLCRGIPAYEVSYPFHEGGASQIEIYCSQCVKKCYQREPVL